MIGLNALILTANAAPVELVPGVEHPGGTSVGVAALGVSLTIPAGCTGTLVDPMLVVRCAGRDGLMGVLAEAGVTPDGLVSALSVPLPLELTTTLVPAGSPVADGDRVRADYTVLLSPRRRGTALALRGATGVGVVLLAAGPTDVVPAWRDAIDATAATLRFAAPPAPATPTPVTQAAVTPAPAAVAPTGPLGSTLAGKRLLYLYSRSGFTDKWTIDLCSDGTFLYRSATSGSSSGPSGDFSASLRGGEPGVWHVDGDQLTLTYQGGNVERAPLVKRSDGWYHGSTRYFLVDENSTCR